MNVINKFTTTNDWDGCFNELQFHLDSPDEFMNSISYMIMAIILEEGTNKMKRDLEGAIKFYEISLKLHQLLPSIRNMALIYEIGKSSIEKDLKKAIELYQKGLEMGDSFCLNQLALIYERGDQGVEKDLLKSIEIYKKGVKRSDRTSINRLACIYENGGDKVEKNIKEAVVKFLLYYTFFF